MIVNLRGPGRDRGMDEQKALLAGWTAELATAREVGRKVAYTFVPGNLVELLAAFDVVPVYPEINALRDGMRQQSAELIRAAERAGHSEDVCSYVKCDLGRTMRDEKALPPPDLLLLSYTGCNTYLKWFEHLADAHRCEVAMLHVPHAEQGIVPDAEAIAYVAGQLRDSVIPALERITGRRYDEERLKAALARSAAAEEALVRVLASGKRRPSPIDAWFGAVHYVGPIFTAFRGSDACLRYYENLAAEVEERASRGEGPPTPHGRLDEQRFRLVVEGPPNWTSFREFWGIFSGQGAVAVASSYTRVGGLYDRGFRHDPDRPLESLAAYCLGCYTNLSLPARVELLASWVRDYEADGFLVHSIKSCNSFSAGQLPMLREVERRTGLPGAFVESDLVDPRYYGHANVKNRIDSYLQMLAQRRGR